MGERELDLYRSKACSGKACVSARVAHDRAAAKRARGEPCDAYRCPFRDEHPRGEAGDWHVGHPMNLDSMTRVAALLRERAGNAPAEPGSGTTKRQRRRAARRGATAA